jgi:integrase
MAGSRKRKQREPWGRIRKLPSGRYQASYTGPDLAVHNASSTFGTLMDARGWLAEERKLVDSGNWAPPKARAVIKAANTFGAYAETWLAGRELKPRTRIEYRRILDGKLLPHFGGLPLKSITRAEVRAWYATLDPAHKTARAHAYALLRTILGTAEDEELITANPCRIKGAGTAKRLRKIKPATLAELETIVTRLPDRYELMVLLAAWCELRFGELTELRHRDLDLKAGVIHVQKAVTWVDGQPIIGDPKSEAGQRYVTIPPFLLPLVKPHLEQYSAPAALPGVEREHDGLIFPSAKLGLQLREQTFHKTWDKARKAAGRPDLRFHDLRHTGATRAAQAGATLAELMYRLGHSTAAAAMIYQHASQERDAELARRMSAERDAELAGSGA